MNIGGTEKHLVQILNTINKNKYNVSLFLLYKNGVYLTQIPQNIKVYKVPKFIEKSGKLSVIFQTIRLFFILIKSKYDLLHFYLPHMYVVKDLVPDMTNFYQQYKSIKPWLIQKDENKPKDNKENIQSIKKIFFLE